MTRLEETEKRIFEKGISKLSQNYNSIEACSIKMDDEYTIFFNPQILNNSTDLNTALAHEFYHCEHNCLYSFNDSLQTRKRREFKANFQMAMDLIPPNILGTYISKRYEIYEISEIYNLTEEFILEAIRIYRSKGLL